MVIKKLKKYWVIGLVFSILLTGCTTEKNKTPETEETMFPESIQYDGDRLKINATITTPDDLNFYQGKGKPITIDYQALGEELMGEEGYEEMGLDNGDIWNRDGYVYNWGDKANHCYYSTPQVKPLINSVYIQLNDSLYNLDSYTERKEFDFATEEEALNDIKELLNRYNICIDDTWKVTTYYLDYETLKAEENVMTMEMDDDISLHKKDWSEANNAYMFFFEPYYGNYPDYHRNGGYSPMAGTSGAPIHVIYGSEGIVQLEINNPYTYEMTDKLVELLPMQDIELRLQQRFDDIVGADNTKFYIYSLELCADAQVLISETTTIPFNQSETEMIPVWVVHFTAADGTFDENAKPQEIRINAATREIYE